MIKKTLYFGNPMYLSLRNSQLMLRKPESFDTDVNPENLSKDFEKTIPIEDIGVVVLDNRQITITNGALDALLGNNCAVITCNAKSMPVGLMLPLQGNTLQNERFRAQIDSSVPQKKQLWQQTVRQKILNQARVLEEQSNETAKNMRVWANDVKSGDPDNLEARSAAFYWKYVFKQHPGFIRGREEAPPNNLLNYGYAILRACVARGLVASGLLPTLGIHHHNRYNAYCLADDIMEPYRPFVDRLVIKIMEEFKDISQLTVDIKSRLLTIPALDVTINGKQSPLMIAVGLTTSSLSKCFSGELKRISYPEIV